MYARHMRGAPALARVPAGIIPLSIRRAARADAEACGRIISQAFDGGAVLIIGAVPAP